MKKTCFLFLLLCTCNIAGHKKLLRKKIIKNLYYFFIKNKYPDHCNPCKIVATKHTCARHYQRRK